MNSKVLYALSGVTAILIGATIYLTPAPTSERATPGERLFANLARIVGPFLSPRPKRRAEAVHGHTGAQLGKRVSHS